MSRILENMLEPWNNALLSPPPVNTFQCKDAFDIADLRSILEDVSQILANQSPLHQEGAIISRLIYKFDKKFRNDIGYRNLKKVNTALKRYLKLNLAKVIDNFYCVVPSADSDDEYLPTRQMLEYVLVRLQSFAKLMVRLCICSKKSAIFYWDRVTRGESHWMSLMPYAVVCRIWSVCSVLLKQTCNWYTKLYGYLHKLQPKGLQFLPENYSLPADIEQWLDVQNLDYHGKFHWSKNRCIEVLSSLEDDDIEDSMDIFQYIQNIRNGINESPLEGVPPSCVSSSKEVEKKESAVVDGTNVVDAAKKPLNKDLGESITRESFQKLAKKKSVEKNQELITDKKEKKIEIFSHKSDKKQSVLIVHNAEMVTDENKMKVFIAKEDRLRNNGNKQSLSSHLSFMQWQSLKTAVNNLHGLGLRNEIVCKKFKKLWKKRCKDYL